MARSVRHTPCAQNCCAKNEVFSKQLSARRLRVAVRSILAAVDEDEVLVPSAREMFNMQYLGPKDGKSFFDPSLPPFHGRRPRMSK